MTGRPTLYRKEYVEQARKLCEFGATEMELADFFEVSVMTIRNWAANHRPFFDALKLGKEQADERVKRSLYHKAIGYSFDAEKIFQYEGEPVKVPYREHIPPDTTACIFWLKNRRPDLWRDKIDVNGKHDHRHAHLHVLAQAEGLDLSGYNADQLLAIQSFAESCGADLPASLPDGGKARAGKESKG